MKILFKNSVTLIDTGQINKSALKMSLKYCTFVDVGCIDRKNKYLE